MVDVAINFINCYIYNVIIIAVPNATHIMMKLKSLRKIG